VVRKTIFAVIVIAVAACLCFFSVSRANKTHRLMLRAYYRHAENVKRGMPVCVDGVQLGEVSSVTVRPELGDRPVEVVVALNPPYDLKIPAGSTAQIAEQGVLGPTIIDIDTHGANGAPLANRSTIEGCESTDDQAAHALGVVVKALVDQSKPRDQRQKPAVTK
jgi:ABC-type transporter Mla subunit MlaD